MHFGAQSQTSSLLWTKPHSPFPTTSLLQGVHASFVLILQLVSLAVSACVHFLAPQKPTL